MFTVVVADAIGLEFPLPLSILNGIVLFLGLLMLVIGRLVIWQVRERLVGLLMAFMSFPLVVAIDFLLFLISRINVTEGSTLFGLAWLQIGFLQPVAVKVATFFETNLTTFYLITGIVIPLIGLGIGIVYAYLSGSGQSLNLSLRIKMLVLFTLLFTIVFGDAFLWFFNFGTNLGKDNLFQDLQATAEAAVAEIDGDEHQALYLEGENDDSKTWPEGMTDERYWEIAEWLLLVNKANPRAYPYTFAPTDDPATVEFVVSFAAALEEPWGAKFREPYTPQPPSVLLNGLKESTLSTNIVTDSFGSWVGAFEPIYDSDGEIVGALGVDYDASNVVKLQRRIESAVVPVFLIVYIVLFGAVLLISDGITAPIRSLTEVAERIGEGEYEEVEILEGGVRDEVTTLTEVFNLMVSKVRQREEKLKKQVAELQIILDEGKQQKQVEEIVDTDFFRDLQSKARAMRARKKSASEG